jgi:hypothetical protein
MAKQIKIETDSGTYVVNKPGGAAGLDHISILFGLQQAGGVRGADFNETQLPMTPAEREKIIPALREWATKVLPTIYVSGPYPLEEIPGEDQLYLMMGVASTIKGGEKPFRVITE